MKKITLLVLGMIAILAVTVKAQDLGVLMVSPSDGSTYTTASDVTLTFTLQNVGSLPLDNGDTVFFEFSIMGTPLLSVYLPLGANTLSAGQAANVSLPQPVQIPVAGNNMPVCIKITRSTLGTDPVSSNNESCVNITVTGTGIDESNPKVNVDVYPNPFADFIRIDCEKVMKSISIYSTSGQMVFSSDLEDNLTEINTASFNEGIYFVQIRTGEGLITKKVLLRR